MDIKIHKNLLWIKPYLESIDDLIDLSKLKRIQGFRVRPNRNEYLDGQICRHSARKYVITINTHHQVFKTTATYKSFERYSRNYLAGVLDSLAHEIAHLAEWEHSTEHLDLQLKLMKRFNIVMKKQKIKDTWQRIPKG